jgi:hypothetical protein
MIAYMLYGLTLSIYRNYTINTHIENFTQTNTQLQAENEEKLKNYEYYNSAEYQDKIAKQNLGLINPGEEVIVIPPSARIEVFELDDIEAQKARKLAKMPNFKRWWEFFFVNNPFRY